MEQPIDPKRKHDYELHFPSDAVAEPLGPDELLEALIEGSKPVPFDLYDGDDLVTCDRIIFGYFLSFTVHRESRTARARVVFDRTTMPMGLKGGEYDLTINRFGDIQIPDQMFGEWNESCM